MKVILVAVVVIIALVIDVLAIRKSKRGTSKAFRFSRYAGIAGIVSFALLLLAFFDLFTQIWVARPGYSGWPVGIAAGLFVGTSVLNLVVLVWLRDNRDTQADNSASGL
jgi:hypothetical protein